MYLIYNANSLFVYGYYKTRAAAKATVSKAQRRLQTGKRYVKIKGRIVKQDAAPHLRIAGAVEFRDHIDYPVVVKNRMSGKDVVIRKSEQGSCVDPSTELYWSM